MNAQELTTLLDRLCREPHETDWLEFKENKYEPQVLGEYLSALANAACLAGKPHGYLIFGVQDKTHAVVGTQFDHQAVKKPRSEIDRLLLDKLPQILSAKQKKAKIHNLMAELAKTGKIENRGSRAQPAWHAVDRSEFNK